MIYFVTTGVSLSESSRCWHSQGRKPEVKQRHDAVKAENVDESANAAKWYRERREEIMVILGTNSAELSGRADQVAAERFDRTCWSADKRRFLPAELATIHAMAQMKKFRSGDEIRFLRGKSNGPEAWLCKATLSWLIESVADPGLKGLDCTMHPKEFNWDPDSNDRFVDEMKRLWQDLRVNEARDLILTGGYKGVILYLSFIAGDARQPFNIYYLHENSRAVIVISCEKHGTTSVRNLQ